MNKKSWKEQSSTIIRLFAANHVRHVDAIAIMVVIFETSRRIFTCRRDTRVGARLCVWTDACKGRLTIQ